MLPGRSLEYRCDCSTVQLMSPVLHWVVTLKVAVIRTGTSPACDVISGIITMTSIPNCDYQHRVL